MEERGDMLQQMQRVGWIDTAKMLTMFLVILGHCTYYNISTPYGGIYYGTSMTEVSLVQRLLNFIVSFIYTFHMPMFMALSGMLFTFSMRKNISFISLVKNKAVRLLIPFLAVSIFLSIPLKYISGYWDYSGEMFLDIILGQILLMGNSHLWFVVSLFWIFLAFYIVEKKKTNGALFWGILLFLSWIGWYLEPKNNFIGLPAAIKHLFFFAIGYNILPNLDRLTHIGKTKALFSLVGIFTLYILFRLFCDHYPELFVTKLLRLIMFTVFALLGIFAVCILAMSLCHKSSFSHLKLFKDNTYELYLYSDPFNYLIIYAGWQLLGNRVLASWDCSLAMFLVRFIGTTLAAVIVIKVVRFLHLKSLANL